MQSAEEYNLPLPTSQLFRNTELIEFLYAPVRVQLTYISYIIPPFLTAQNILHLVLVYMNDIAAHGLKIRHQIIKILFWLKFFFHCIFLSVKSTTINCNIIETDFVFATMQIFRSRV